jgi:hypothetical protein
LIYINVPEQDPKTVPRLALIDAIAATSGRAIAAAIKPDSIAVTPDSSFM